MCVPEWHIKTSVTTGDRHTDLFRIRSWIPRIKMRKRANQRD
jgi:hypothetical protein